VFVKICGITNPADAEAIIAAGADALGTWSRIAGILPEPD
jgi:phosphoribosylanthranilate isomerase